MKVVFSCLSEFYWNLSLKKLFDTIFKISTYFEYHERTKCLTLLAIVAFVQRFLSCKLIHVLSLFGEHHLLITTIYHQGELTGPAPLIENN